MLRRIAFGIFWFGIFWMAFLVVGGGISGSLASSSDRPTPGAVVKKSDGTSQPPGMNVDTHFHERFGTWVIVGAAALSLVCTVAGVLPGTRR